MRVLNFEYMMMIPCIPNTNEPDLSVCQRVWWDTIHLVQGKAHKNPKDCPLRLLLEMKFIANSEILMAPSHNCQWGTCIIEVVSPMLVKGEGWQVFKQELSDLWLSYGTRTRPHWAKEWDVKINGKSMEDHIKTVYADEIPVFQKTLKKIAKNGGYSIDQMQQVYCPASFKKIFF